MSTAEAPPRLMTAEEFLALPEDGIHRELIRGVVRVFDEQQEGGLTVRNRFHCKVEGRAVQHLNNWLDDSPKPHGEVLCGEAGFRLKGPEDSVVGIDVAYVGHELVGSTPRKQRVYGDPPILAVQILSPSDTVEAIADMVELYLEADVAVWEVDYRFRSVRVHRSGQDTQTFSGQQILVCEPELPGFRLAVDRLFGA